MYILGISCYYHDSSATLLKDGKVVAAIQEERLTRKKHDVSFPKKAIEKCLEIANITLNEVEYIGFYEKPFLKFERIIYQHLQMFPRSYKVFLSSISPWFTEKLKIVKKIKKLGFKNELLFVDHHLAHSAGSFFPSPFEKAAILNLDGVGEWTTSSYGVGDKNNVKLLKEIDFPSSLGLLYSTITTYLGFRANNSEYKVMGLAAYGESDREKNPYYEKLMSLIDLKNDGSFRFDMSNFVYHFSERMPSRKLCRLLGGSVRKPGSEVTQRHKDIAAALQFVYEDILIKMLNHIYNETKSENLVLAGGCGLNSVANGKILKNTPFKHFWSQPDPGDGGTSLGVAFYIYNQLLKNKRTHGLNSAYLGPSFTADQIKRFLDKNKIKYSTFKDNKKLITSVAKLIYENSVVGWFQGRMEWGPRALGARSILSNPCNLKAQDLLNLKVKHREKFRPFAPVICKDDALKYFDCDQPIPESTDFMLMVYPILKQWHKKIPAVTHVDGTGRLQTVTRKQNELYYDLIKEFGKLSKIPILINTSFNIRGEPIVCSMYDAYKCMMGTEIDYLVIDKFLIKRSDNPRHIWDSTKTINEN
ncbi:hypothetical protein GOV14_06895 [Candidatus Pacearchaeota archaeon]|nr:hypothetical protein [Candidatus Pacearchaeota archaeon]